ncbi:MAG: hypothetical protein HQ594_05585, partial [Candidatus Omnitrophica bacterium]|nr:hypothetical protein [Candidatus Omnitrophota bacterium]
MSKSHNTIKICLKKATAITIAVVFLYNTTPAELAMGQAGISKVSIVRDNLQVESMFKPFLDPKDEPQAMVEAAMILALVLENNDRPYYEINAVLNRWKSTTPDKKRLLEAAEIQPESYRNPKDGSTVINLRISSKPGKFCSIRSTSNSIEDIQFSQEKTRIEPNHYISTPKDISETSDGLIAKGGMQVLAENLKEQISDKSGGIKKQNRLYENKFKKEARKLKKITDESDLDDKIKTYVYQAIDNLVRYNKVRFNAIVLGAKSVGKKRDHWLLGFNSQAPPFKKYLQSLFKSPTLGYAAEALDQLHGHTFLEYILHEPLCALVGHKKARNIQQQLFRDTLYSDNKEGELSSFLRSIIDAKAYGRNLAYVDAAILDGKRVGGKFIGAGKGKPALKHLLKQFPGKEIVIEKFQMNNGGGLSFYGKKYINKIKGYESAFVTLVFKDNEVLAVYDENGNGLYPFDSFCVYSGGSMKSGKRVGGKLVAALNTRHNLFRTLDKLGGQRVIVEGVELDEKGALYFATKSYWKNMSGYEKTKVNIEYEGGCILSVHDQGGKKLYPFEENLVYVDGKMKNGKRVGGKFLQSFMTTMPLENVFKDYPDRTLIVEKFRLDNLGGLTVNGELYWKEMKGYENAFFTLVIRNGKLVEAYDENNKKLYPFSRYLLYVDATIDKGVVKGTLVGTYSGKRTLEKVARKHKDSKIFIKHFDLGVRGRFRFNGKTYWHKKEEYKNTFVTLEVDNGKVTAVYDQEGTKIYPFKAHSVY